MVLITVQSFKIIDFVGRSEKNKGQAIYWHIPERSSALTGLKEERTNGE